MAASDKLITFTRQEFYNRIWSMPISTLAKELGIKPYKIIELCHTHHIPRPAMGYWSKARHGRTPAATPLLPLEDDTPSITILPDALRAAYYKEESEEHRQGIVDRLHRQNTEEEHWRRLTDMADNWRQAENIRAFLSALAAAVATDDKLSHKAAALASWAEGQLRLLDPISHDPALVFEEMEEPVPPPTTLEIVQHLY